MPRRLQGTPGLRRAAFIHSGAARATSSAPGARRASADACLANTAIHDRHQLRCRQRWASRRASKLGAPVLHRNPPGAGDRRACALVAMSRSATSSRSDGLRLSKGMGRKNALAGLWWARGGKGVIARAPGRRHDEPRLPRAALQDYGRFISPLRGAWRDGRGRRGTTELDVCGDP